MRYKTENRTFYDFENDYKRRYGIYLDHDWIKLIEKHGERLANDIIHEKITNMYSEIARQMEAERLKRDHPADPQPVFQNISALDDVPFT